MTRRVLIVSHADADGHLIAEQTRRNLDLIPCFEVSTFVDPQITKDHGVWSKLGSIPEVEGADIVLFVDLMFAPTSFAAEATALVDFVRAYPEKQFFLVDHHPLPFRRLEAAPNLRVAYRPDVFECTVGPRSGMMVVAAICEKQNALVADIKVKSHELLASGMRRAAALGGPLPGEKLLSLLQHDSWDELAQLGSEDKNEHYLPRGRRPAGSVLSAALKQCDLAATNYISGTFIAANSLEKPAARSPIMPYDSEVAQGLNIGDQRFPIDAGKRSRQNSTVHSKDLEAIVTLLEVAALTLTTEPNATFSFERLCDEARELGGDEVTINDRDVKIVLEKASFLEKMGREYRLK